MYRRLQGHQAVAIKVTGCAYRLPHDGTLDYRRRRITQPGYAWSGSFASRFVNSGPAGKKTSPQTGYVQEFQDNLREAHQYSLGP